MSQRKSRKNPYTTTLHNLTALKYYCEKCLKEESVSLWPTPQGSETLDVDSQTILDKRARRTAKYTKRLHEIEYKKFIMKLTDRDLKIITKIFEYMNLVPFNQKELLETWGIYPDCIYDTSDKVDMVEELDEEV